MITLLVILLLIVIDTAFIKAVGELIMGLIGGLMLLDGFVMLGAVLLKLIF